MAVVTMEKGSSEVRSSLPYQILLFLNQWYFGFFVIVEILLFLYKGVSFPYPRGYIAAEVILLVFLSTIEATRIFFGMKGNLTERNLGVVLSIVLTVPAVLGVLYYLLWQTYVLRIEVILIAVQLIFQSLESIFALLCLVRFSRSAIA